MTDQPDTITEALVPLEKLLRCVGEVVDLEEFRARGHVGVPHGATCVTLINAYNVPTGHKAFTSLTEAFGRPEVIDVRMLINIAWTAREGFNTLGRVSIQPTNKDGYSIREVNALLERYMSGEHEVLEELIR